MRHKLLKHEAGECRTEGSCHYCDGGLSFCTVCKGAEGDLPTDCPGRALSQEEGTHIYSGTLDYVNGQWVTK